GAWTADVDLDGDLDVVLGPSVKPGSATAGAEPLALRNNGDGTWGTVRPFGGVSGATELVWADLDGNAAPDVALLDGSSQLAVFLNQRGGYYKKADLGESGGKALALAVADADQNGALDLAVLRPGGAIQSVSIDAQSGWRQTELARWDQTPTSGGARLIWAELDNNGALDLIASGPSGTSLWLGDEQLKLQPLSVKLDARVFAAEDLTDDGRLDLVGVSKDGRPTRLVNGGGKTYHWQGIRPRNASAKDGDQKINAFGIGGQVGLRAGLLVQTQPITGPKMHFGLGEQTAANVVRITWPNGQFQGEFDLAADHSPLANQRLTGSCPWLFAFDGKSMNFVTDILWKSPLGLRINAQDTAGVSQTLDWVKVRGDQLAPKDGFYDLRITAELWESDFFDHVSLMVVDHPENTEIFLDERFSIPQPELKVHVTTPPVPVSRATDQLGADVTEIVRAVDGRYLDTFPLGRYQGVAQDHYVEVELPSGAEARSLLATGWVFPTDSSINVAISQGRQPKPEGLSIEIPDGKGGWKVARKGLGFPAGKYKSVLLDLAGLFPGGASAPQRLRLRTNMEIYWDALAVVAPVEHEGKSGLLSTRRIDPETAELRYRGFSQLKAAPRSTPETPDYNRIAGTHQQWLDLVGYYTRFGDVRELLTTVDDRYVIMNAGDEIRLRFAAPPPPPAGWKRDYVFVSDGWDKDGNYNTSYSETVLPLPSHSRPAYNTPPGKLEQDPVYLRHSRDWLTYHTRYVDITDLRDALRPAPAVPGGRKPAVNQP
ncbi:MAG: FG-GAP-like repeat-containing protein, partial [Actinomycetota bacterium]